jgi:hypothetical protein
MSVCNKLNCFQMDVETFYNITKKCNEFGKVSVSTISRKIVSFERESLSIDSPRECFKISAFLRYGVLSMKPSLKAGLLETKR